MTPLARQHQITEVLLLLGIVLCGLFVPSETDASASNIAERGVAEPGAPFAPAPAVDVTSADSTPLGASIVDASIADAILERIEWLAFDRLSTIEGVSVLSGDLLNELYSAVSHAPLWESREQVEALWTLAEIAHREGLNTADYPLDALGEALGLVGLPVGANQRASLDILATETFLRIGYQLRFGKVTPEQHFAAWNFQRSLAEGQERVDTILGVIRSPSLVEAVNQITNRGVLFDEFIGMLAELREVEARGGWPKVPEGPTLRPAMSDGRVLALRARLGIPASLSDSPLYDDGLKEQVRGFQERHGLDADGIAGGKTIAAMNVPVSERILQVRASLERARWIFDDYQNLSGGIVIVNIASAQVAFWNGREQIWSGRAQVGLPYRQTPVFRGDMTYLEFNPTWTVPPTILKKDVLPRLRLEGEAYLEEKNMDLLDLDGRPVPLEGLDWENLGRSGFP
ncbi:MAG: peptidoglycan-binding protein, partial [Pseudomonadota bacterium]